MDWSTFTNTALLAVDTSLLSPTDLQTYAEELNVRGLSSAPPPTLPTIQPASTPTTLGVVSAGGFGYEIGVADDGSLVTNRVHVQIPDGIADGQTLVYDLALNRLVPAGLPGGSAPGNTLLDDADSSLLNDETGTGWFTEDDAPAQFLLDDADSTTLTDEGGVLALTGG